MNEVYSERSRTKKKSVLYHSLSQVLPLVNTLLQYLFIVVTIIELTLVPLIFATLTVGIAGHGDVKNLGKIGLKTIVYFEIATTIA